MMTENEFKEFVKKHNLNANQVAIITAMIGLISDLAKIFTPEDITKSIKISSEIAASAETEAIEMADTDVKFKDFIKRSGLMNE